ncbi:MAG: hypothetical protein KC416_00610 [Myxococcales bacterium]|nr:hypothetical protein [Myxococcales bacterium]
MTWTSEPPESELPTDDGILMGFRAWPTDGRRPLSHSLRLPPWGISLGASVMAIDIRWAELVMLRPVDPWPDLFVAWRHVGGISSCVFSPHSRFGEDDTRIERVVDHVRAARPHLVQEGWLKRPDLAWESVPSFPGEGTSAEGPGVYRRAARVEHESVIAARHDRTVAEGLLHFLRRWFPGHRKGIPRRVAVTEAHLYAEFDQGDIVRLSLEHLWSARRTVTGGLLLASQDPSTPSGLRGYCLTTPQDKWVVWPTGHRLRPEDVPDVSTTGGDTIYVFGRRTQLVLPHRPGCPVTRVLDRRLAGLDP